MIDFGRVKLEPYTLTENKEDSYIQLQLEKLNEGIQAFLEEYYLGAEDPGKLKDQKEVMDLFDKYIASVSWSIVVPDHTDQLIDNDWWQNAKHSFYSFKTCCEAKGLTRDSRYLCKLFATVGWLLDLGMFNNTVPLHI